MQRTNKAELKDKKTKEKKVRIKKKIFGQVVRRSKKGPVAPILEMLVTIVERGKAHEVEKYLTSTKVATVVSFGSGTAESYIQNLLGLYNKEKEVIFALIPVDKSNEILDNIEEKFLKEKDSAGIAFTVVLKSIVKSSLNLIV